MGKKGRKQLDDDDWLAEMPADPNGDVKETEEEAEAPAGIGWVPDLVCMTLLGAFGTFDKRWVHKACFNGACSSCSRSLPSPA